jgi:hypothetical protein
MGKKEEEEGGGGGEDFRASTAVQHQTAQSKKIFLTFPLQPVLLRRTRNTTP